MLSDYLFLHCLKGQCREGAEEEEEEEEEGDEEEEEGKG